MHARVAVVPDAVLCVVYVPPWTNGGCAVQAAATGGGGGGWLVTTHEGGGGGEPNGFALPVGQAPLLHCIVEAPWAV